MGNVHRQCYCHAKQRELWLDEYCILRECTYIALGLGKPVQGGANADGWRCATERSYITIGYAAWMNGIERKQLQNTLVDTPDGWRNLAPKRRPMELTRHRRAEKLTLKEKLRVEKAEAERGGPQDYHCESVKIEDDWFPRLTHGGVAATWRLGRRAKVVGGRRGCGR